MNEILNSKIPPLSKQIEWVTDPFNRYYRYPISTRLAVLLRNTPLTPNQVTFMHTGFGLMAGVCVSRGTVEAQLLAFWLYEVRMILDCLDGSLAREKKMYSEFGRQMDGIGDGVAFVGLLVGAGVAFSREHPEFSSLQMIGLMAGTFQMTLMLAGAYDFYRRRYTSALKTGRDELEDVYFRSQLRIATGVAAPLDRISSAFDWLQLSVLAPEMMERVHARVRQVRNDPAIVSIASHPEQLDAYSKSFPVSDQVQRLIERAKVGRLRGRLRHLAFVGADNHLMVIQIGLLTHTLWGAWWVGFVYAFVFFFSSLWIHRELE